MKSIFRRLTIAHNRIVTEAASFQGLTPKYSIDAIKPLDRYVTAY